MTISPRTPPLPWLTWPAVLAILATICLPFALVDIPPLVDVPGHIGGAAIAAAPPGSPLHAFYSWDWQAVPNLGGEVLIHLIAKVTGVTRAGWWVMLLATAAWALGGMMTVRALNPRGGHGLGWALIFVLGFPWLWGFINYVLASGLALVIFALSLRLARRPVWRALLLLTGQPLLIACHAIGGLMLPLLVGAEALGVVLDQRRQRPVASLAADLVRRCWPLALSLLMVAAWKLTAQPVADPGMHWDFLNKLDFLMEVLRDQNVVLDMGCAVAAYVLVIFSRWLGARWTWRQGTPGLAVLACYALLPERIDGSEIVDVRLLTLAMLLALGLLDWSQAPARTRRIVAWSGGAVLALRLGIIAVQFPVYQASYTAELRALDPVTPGARVLLLRRQSCANVEWRMSRLDNLGALASVERQAWINSHWQIKGLHMLSARYDPAPSNPGATASLVWDARCPNADGRSLDIALAAAPLAGVDYVWLLDTGAPTASPPQLDAVWRGGRSFMYRVRR